MVTKKCTKFANFFQVGRSTPDKTGINPNNLQAASQGAIVWNTFSAAGIQHILCDLVEQRVEAELNPMDGGIEKTHPKNVMVDFYGLGILTKSN